jgi:succinate-acetate transporter protein
VTDTRLRDTRPAGERAAWDDLMQHTVIVLRPMAAGTPLGFFGLAAATFVLSGLQLGWIDTEQAPNVALVLIVFAFACQLAAGVLALFARDVVIGTAMTVLALTWLVTGLVMRTSTPGATSDALGLYLVFAGSVIALCGIAASLGKVVPAAVLLLAAVRIIAAGIYHLAASEWWKEATGIIGVVLFAAAMYTALAAMLEGAAGKPVLPLGRRQRGRVAVDGSLLEQVQGVVNEPGVRLQL